MSRTQAVVQFTSIVTVLTLLLCGCDGPGEGAPAEPAPGATGMSLTSKAFGDGQPIPRRYTGDGANVSPPLSWAGLPRGTRELALICDDPDAPRAEPWVHWVIYRIGAEVSGLKEDIPRTDKLEEPAGALQGRNSSGTIGYRGPAPPRGHGVHHYHFRLYALDAKLEVKPGLNKAALLRAMAGHILAEADLVGTYKR